MKKWLMLIGIVMPGLVYAQAAAADVTIRFGNAHRGYYNSPWISGFNGYSRAYGHRYNIPKHRLYPSYRRIPSTSIHGYYPHRKPVISNSSRFTRYKNHYRNPYYNQFRQSNRFHGQNRQYRHGYRDGYRDARRNGRLR